MRPLTVALGAGRLAQQAFTFLEKIVSFPTTLDKSSRSLIMEDVSGRFRFLLIRNRDVLAILNSGGADMGIIGLDLLLENYEQARDLTFPIRFDFARCKLSIACQKDSFYIPPLGEGNYAKLPMPLRIATKYPNLTRNYFAKQGLPVEIIRLNGSMEVAPRIGISHCIVDLVSTGKTLRDNCLVEVKTILNSQAILLIRRGSYAWHGQAICEFIEKCQVASKIK